MKGTCGMCKRRLDVESDPLSMDCGGYCLLCMAEADDPDAIDYISSIPRKTIGSDDRDSVETLMLTHETISPSISDGRLEELLSYYHPQDLKSALLELKLFRKAQRQKEATRVDA